jgi:hypothetical protein
VLAILPRMREVRPARNSRPPRPAKGKPALTLVEGGA